MTNATDKGRVDKWQSVNLYVEVGLGLSLGFASLSFCKSSHACVENF